jgi:hypothetical protein
MIDRQEARSDVARIDPAADRWLHSQLLLYAIIKYTLLGFLRLNLTHVKFKFFSF